MMNRSFVSSIALAALLATVCGCKTKEVQDPERVSPHPDTATLVRTDSAHVDTAQMKADPRIDSILTAMKARRDTSGITIGIPETVLFKTGDANLLPGARATLEEIRDVAMHYGSVPIAVNGYTDNQGKPEDNLALSEKRATAVKDYLVNTLKVSNTSLSAKGFGEASPVAPNTTPDGRQQNRRVEIFIKSPR